MASITDSQRIPSGVIATASYTHHQQSKLDQKVTHVAGNRLPCFDLLSPCLTDYLKGNVSSDTIEDAANYLQNILIPANKEHSTVQKELLNWKGRSGSDFESVNRLHPAILHCMKLDMPSHQRSALNHSDK